MPKFISDYETYYKEAFPLEGWGKKVTYHERLKESYYMLKDYWTAAG